MRVLASLFQRRFRGFRIVDLAAFGCLSVLVLGVYAFKARAGGESSRIGDVDSQIVDQQHRIRLLNAELARLEQPERLERLSTQVLGLAPIPAKHETTPTSLMEISRQASSGANPSPARATGAKATSAQATGAKDRAVKVASSKPGAAAGSVSKVSAPVATPAGASDPATTGAEASAATTSTTSAPQ